MAALINRCLIITLFACSCFNLKAQDKICIRFTENVCKKKFDVGDTLKISFKNLTSDTLHYYLEVMMQDKNEWIYSPFYSKYFNFELTYSEMDKMFSSKLPKSFSQDYRHKSSILLPNKTSSFSFVVEKNEKLKKLIKFRVNLVNKIDFNETKECKLTYSSPFYFIRIKE